MGEVRFSETMAGSVAREGESTFTPLSFRLDISVRDVDSHFTDTHSWAEAQGWIDCDSLGGRRPVSNGRFKLFRADESAQSGQMLYELPFVDGLGNQFVLKGKKTVRNDRIIDMWRDTTRLATKIVDQNEMVIAHGTVTISPIALFRMAATFRGAPLEVARFLGRFALVLANVYGRLPRR